MFAVGLTGGIASGKTTISDLFAARGVTVIDTDVISRQLLEPGELAFDQVCEHFGEDVLQADAGPQAEQALGHQPGLRKGLPRALGGGLQAAGEQVRDRRVDPFAQRAHVLAAGGVLHEGGQQGALLSPGVQASTGQYRELSGVSTSSIKMISPSCQPNSNLVSARMIPRSAA